MSLCVVAIGRHDLRYDEAWLIVGLLLAFASFHTAVHGANVSVISTVLCARAVYLASHDSDLRAGNPARGGHVFAAAFWHLAIRILSAQTQVATGGGRQCERIAFAGGSFARIGLPLNAVLSN